MVVAAILFTASLAHAEPSLAPFGAFAVEAKDLVQTACDLDVRFHGAIVEADLRQRFANHADTPIGAVEELELPAGAQLIGLSAGGVRALGIANGFPTQPADPATVGHDPAIAQALAPTESGRPRFRVIAEPFAPASELVIELHWTAAATIHDGALHLALPGLAPDQPPCRGGVRAEVGPGVAIGKIAVGGLTPRTFALGTADVQIDIPLTFSGADPVVWSQTEALGSGRTARAITVLAPPARARGHGRALLLVDGSRSMELVGRHNVTRLIHAIAATLPPDDRLEAIVFDRTPVRVLGDFQSNTAATLQAIDDALDKHTAGNGTDPVAAAALARKVLGDISDQPMVVTITDGAFGDVPSSALVAAFDSKPDDLHVQAIVLDPGRMHATAADVLHAPAIMYGGAFVEVEVERLDQALAAVESWLRPAWHELKLTGTAGEVPDELFAGAGAVAFEIERGGSREVKLAAGSGRKVKLSARAAPSAPIAQLALAPASLSELDDNIDTAEKLRARLTLAHPAADSEHALAVLSQVGRVAGSRRAMVAGGGPYIRTLATEDPTFPPDIVIGRATAIGGSAIDREILERMLRLQLQPKAYSCYERALAHDAKLAGTATFHLDIGRGEVTRASIDGLGNAAFDACLLDAAYGLAPPLPNPDFNVDDRTLANYPITFAVHEDHPHIVAGDADSSSPLDIDNIQGGLPGHITPVDTKTPLGNLRPTPMP